MNSFKTIFFKKNNFRIVIFVYHLLFTFFAYQYFLSKGGDSQLYWFLKGNQVILPWVDYLSLGTNFILFLNYPFAVLLQLPIWVGFIVYSIVGYYAILSIYEWSLQWIPQAPKVFGISILQLLVFLPNIHFWTSFLGKESLILLSLIIIFQSITRHNYYTFKNILAVILLILLRPHVALFLFSAVFFVFVFWNSKNTLQQKLIFVLLAVPLLSGLFYSVLQLTKIKYWDWERITKFNTYSMDSFQHADSYVPMTEYSIVERIFAFNFRPFFLDSNSLLSLVVSIENAFVLVLLLLTFCFSILYFKRWHFNEISKIIVIFALVSCLFYIQRYACLGIFLRTKVMYMPFVLLVCVYLYSQIRPVKTN
jgi:hypothetical protein